MKKVEELEVENRFIFDVTLFVKRLMTLLTSFVVLHFSCAFAAEPDNLNHSNPILSKLIDEMFSCDRVINISLAKEIKAEIRKLSGFRELPKMPLRDEAGKVGGWIYIYEIRETYAGLKITEIRQSIMSTYKSANLWIAFDASMPRVKEKLKSKLGIEFEDSEVFDAMPDRSKGDLFSFYEGTDASIDLDYFSAKPGKIYMSCRRTTK